MANKTKKEAAVRGSGRGKRYSGRGRPRSGPEKKARVKKGDGAPEKDRGPQSNGGQKVSREKEVPVDEPAVKRLKGVEPFHLSEQQRALIQEDELNRKLWEEAMNYLLEGPNFLKKVEQLFMCVCCQELAFQPVTTVCLHNVCKTCLQRSFRAEVYTCPACRHDLGKDYVMILNKTLQVLLDQFFPGYSKGR